MKHKSNRIYIQCVLPESHNTLSLKDVTEFGRDTCFKQIILVNIAYDRYRQISELYSYVQQTCECHTQPTHASRDSGTRSTSASTRWHTFASVLAENSRPGCAFKGYVTRQSALNIITPPMPENGNTCHMKLLFLRTLYRNLHRATLSLDILYFLFFPA